MGLNLIAATVVGLLEIIVLIELAYSEDFESSGETKFCIKRNDPPLCYAQNIVLRTYCQPGEVCVNGKDNPFHRSCKSGKKDTSSGKVYIDVGRMQLCSDIERDGFSEINDLGS